MTPWRTGRSGARSGIPTRLLPVGGSGHNAPAVIAQPTPRPPQAGAPAQRIGSWPEQAFSKLQGHCACYVLRMFTERTHVLLSPEQRQRLENRAAQERRSIGAVIRAAVDAYTGSPSRSRQEAAESLLSIGAPVSDWEKMKVEIIRGATRGPRT